MQGAGRPDLVGGHQGEVRVRVRVRVGVGIRVRVGVRPLGRPDLVGGHQREEAVDVARDRVERGEHELLLVGRDVVHLELVREVLEDLDQALHRGVAVLRRRRDLLRLAVEGGGDEALAQLRAHHGRRRRE